MAGQRTVEKGVGDKAAWIDGLSIAGSEGLAIATF